MKSIPILLTLVVSHQLVSAQEKLSREEALYYARAVAPHATQVQGLPVATEVDLTRPVAMREEDYGGLVLPQKGLTVETLAAAGETPVPVGQLWFHRLAPVRHGEAVPRSALRMVTVRTQGDEATVPQCTLAVRRTAAGALELLVYGKAKEPLLQVPLRSVETPASEPIDLAAVREGDFGRLTLKLLGRYQATLSVTELADW
ncbi:MAG: hypothetical protein KF833_09715 [Verrucomicrobiae bacterium]|nr:hypothetical protein [Verrucomicrobiae bacterium]